MESRGECFPEVARLQIDQLVGSLVSILASNLIGVYVHGSLAMRCFNPERSDVDILVVTKRQMAAGTKRSVIELLLRHSMAPHPIEISFLRWQDLHPWEYPTPFDLHYSEAWRERYQEHLASGEWRRWLDQLQDKDPDLAAHVTVTLHRGIRLHGQPIDQVFPAVPKEHYVASILADFADAQARIASNPVYGVLNLCRVYWYLLEGQISSKAEAGMWAVQFLPREHQTVVAQALALYQGRSHDERFNRRALKRFAQFAEGAVKSLLGHQQAR